MNAPFLFTPGPTPVPDRVLAALAKPIINHRSEDFKKLFEKIRAQLKELFGTKNEVICLTASGTGAMEACIVSLLKKSDSVVVVDAGKFGARFSKIAQAYGIKADVVKIEWGQSVTTNDLEKVMTGNHAALCIQASETSTGVAHPIK